VSWNSPRDTADSRFEPDHDDLPIVPFITSYLSTSAPSKDEGGALALPPPPYPAWLWPQQAPIPTGSRSTSTAARSERALSTVSNASNTSSGLPFPNPLTVRRHPSMRLGFGNVPAQPPEKPTAPGLWRTRSNTASRVVSDKPRAPSPRDTLNSRSDSGDYDERPRQTARVSFNDNMSSSGILTRSPATLPSALRYSNEQAPEDAVETTDEQERVRSAGATDGDADVEDDYALDSADEEGDSADEDEYESEDEDEEEEEEEEEPPVSQYISALDLAGM
jgi:hypothetical protein